jgi:hypothetical protein
MANAVFIIVELLFLAATHLWCGPPWTVIGALAILAQMLGGVRIESLALVVPSLVWLGLSHATGNRELFFPYSMHLASCVALREAPRAAERVAWPGAIGGGVVVAAFMIIRILQQATVRVLAVEFVVAAAILAVVVMANSWHRRRVTPIAPIVWTTAIVVASSLLAYASLAL